MRLSKPGPFVVFGNLVLAFFLCCLALPAATGSSPALTPVAAKACHPGADVRAEQVVVVRSAGTRATVTACRRVSGGTYVVALGPYTGYVGRRGVATKGAKREDDGRTPTGVFALRGGFGVHGNPGVRFGWLRADRRDVWVDDSRSRYYNLHERTPANGRWSSAEHLRVWPSYEYAQVIGYNEARTPGRGSAIFLHVDSGRATAGCVSVPRASLVKLLRWERRGAVIAIARTAPTVR